LHLKDGHESKKPRPVSLKVIAKIPYPRRWTPSPSVGVTQCSSVPSFAVFEQIRSAREEPNRAGEAKATESTVAYWKSLDGEYRKVTNQTSLVAWS
jgi:hypothetical protein